MSKCMSENCAISCLLRLSMVVLFGVAAFGKFQGGLDNIVGQFQAMFKDSWLPMPLVIFQARVIPWVEAAIALWLLSGIELRKAWFYTGLFTITLAFGLLAAKQNAADIYIFILICCVGIYFSKDDTCSIDKLGKK